MSTFVERSKHVKIIRFLNVQRWYTTI